jgi:hypothetical protein
MQEEELLRSTTVPTSTGRREEGPTTEQALPDLQLIHRGGGAPRRFFEEDI